MGDEASRRPFVAVASEASGEMNSTDENAFTIWYNALVGKIFNSSKVLIHHLMVINDEGVPK